MKSGNLFLLLLKRRCGKYLSCICLKEHVSSYRCVIAAAGCYGKTASAYLSDFWSAIFYSNCHQWFYRCHCYGNTAGFCGDSGRSPLNGIPYVHGPCSQQISPTHVCLVVAADYFHVTLGDIVKKTLPVSIAFCVLMTLYYNVIKL